MSLRDAVRQLDEALAVWNRAQDAHTPQAQATLVFNNIRGQLAKFANAGTQPAEIAKALSGGYKNTWNAKVNAQGGTAQYDVDIEVGVRVRQPGLVRRVTRAIRGQ